MTMNSFLPPLIRRHRQRQKLTLQGVSDRTGMSPQHLSEIESGKRDVQLSSIERIAAALDVTVMLVPTNMASAVRRFIEHNGRSFSSPHPSFMESKRDGITETE